MIHGEVNKSDNGFSLRIFVFDFESQMKEIDKRDKLNRTWRGKNC